MTALLFAAGLGLSHCQAAPGAALCVPEEYAWADDCFEQRAGITHVKQEYMSRIMTDQHGYTRKMTASSGLVALDRQGKVLLTHILITGDHEDPGLAEGMGRFEVPVAGGGAKCGYYRASGYSVAIPAIYDACMPFERGQARVCLDCRLDCADAGCEKMAHFGREGLILNRHNKVVKRVSLRAHAGTPRARQR